MLWRARKINSLPEGDDVCLCSYFFVVYLRIRQKRSRRYAITQDNTFWAMVKLILSDVLLPDKVESTATQ
ncbi:hypothetical protein D4L85_25840 [Chryseolinea soli]|uniref:Uncharacterized protein n=1 Tax=Chryseolinea soli TaxID=2321403 RepID=A0A385SVQ7_9BACT|nr:hypothetical protein D4L85_25840 [Chryseolinea soli]